MESGPRPLFACPRIRPASAAAQAARSSPEYSAAPGCRRPEQMKASREQFRGGAGVHSGSGGRCHTPRGRRHAQAACRKSGNPASLCGGAAVAARSGPARCDGPTATCESTTAVVIASRAARGGAHCSGETVAGKSAGARSSLAQRARGLPFAREYGDSSRSELFRPSSETVTGVVGGARRLRPALRGGPAGGRDVRRRGDLRSGETVAKVDGFRRPGYWPEVGESCMPPRRRGGSSVVKRGELASTRAAAAGATRHAAASTPRPPALSRGILHASAAARR